MEFGIFLNGYMPGPRAHDSDWEHQRLMREAEYAVFADKHDADRVHSTDRYRTTAVRKYETFNQPLPATTWPTVLPVTALETSPAESRLS